MLAFCFIFHCRPTWWNKWDVVADGYKQCRTLHVFQYHKILLIQNYRRNPTSVITVSLISPLSKLGQPNWGLIGAQIQIYLDPKWVTHLGPSWEPNWAPLGLAHWGDNILWEQDSILWEQDSILREWDSILRERDSILQEQDSIWRERDGIWSEQNGISKEWDGICMKMVWAWNK